MDASVDAALPASPPSQPTPGKTRIQRRGNGKPIKLDREKVKRLHAKGLSSAEIAPIVGVHQSTVWRYLDSIDAEKIELNKYKIHRADVFAGLQGKALSLQHKLIEHLQTDGVLEALSDGAKVQLANSINNVFGTAYDKERLERRQSTQNQSMMHRILGAAFDRVHNPLNDKGTPNVS